MLYGAPPGTGTGKLSVPHQNPGGPSPAGSRSAAVTAFPIPAVTVAAAVPALVSTSARPTASASQLRLMMPPADWVNSGSPSSRPHYLPLKTIRPNGWLCSLSPGLRAWAGQDCLLASIWSKSPIAFLTPPPPDHCHISA